MRMAKVNITHHQQGSHSVLLWQATMYLAVLGLVAHMLPTPNLSECPPFAMIFGGS